MEFTQTSQERRHATADVISASVQGMLELSKAQGLPELLIQLLELARSEAELHTSSPDANTGHSQ